MRKYATFAGSFYLAGSRSAWASIVDEGIHAAARTHVHLAPDEGSVVGKRAGVELLLECSSSGFAREGLGIYRAPNGVVLVRFVPAKLIMHLHPQTRAATRALLAGELRAPLGKAVASQMLRSRWRPAGISSQITRWWMRLHR